MEEIEKLIEAALFMTSKPLTIFDLTKITKANLHDIKVAIKNLQNEYNERGSWIEIIKIDRSYLMRLKPQYADKIADFAQETELSKRALRVLAIVANNDGIIQSKVSRILGPSAYEGVKELEEKNYITTEKKGHSKILRLTSKFKTYFGEIPLGREQREEKEEIKGEEKREEEKKEEKKESTEQ